MESRRYGTRRGKSGSCASFSAEGMACSVFHHSKEAPDLHPQIVKQARKSGQLNLTNRGWATVPIQVWEINSLSDQELKSVSVSLDNADDRWWEQVELTRLNLANNHILEIPNDIAKLSALQYLDLHDNQLTSLPFSVGELHCLTRLNLSHNKFMEVPISVFLLKDLRFLHMQNNRLQSVHEDISNLSRLEDLNLSCNQLNNLPTTMGFLSNIMYFHVSENIITNLHPEIGSMTAIRVLDLSNNALSNLPSDIGDLTRLEQLYLRHNRLTILPVLHSCGNLKELYCGNNVIRKISGQSIECISGLKILELRDNKLASIPDNIISLQSLQRLDITNNSISSLPSAMGLMPLLSSLSLEGNPLKNIRRDIIQRGTAHLLKYLRSRLEAEEPENILLKSPHRPINNVSLEAAANIEQYTLRNTKALNFSNKQAFEIPDNLLHMAAECEVTTVNFSKNNLTAIPSSVEAVLNCLTEFDLGCNQLTELPSIIGTAARLTFLDLHSNRLDKLPAEFGCLANLREICLSSNRFSDIPSCLYSLQKLEILLISDNRVEQINIDGLFRLPVLTVLDLRNNDISSIPPELGNLKQIRSLQLEGNKFRQPRPAILAKGTDAILHYLRDRIPN